MEHRRVGWRTSGRVSDHLPIAMLPRTFVIDFTVVDKGARIRRAAVKRFAAVGHGQDVGLGVEADRCRYQMDRSGLVVIPRRGRRKFHGDAEAR